MNAPGKKQTGTSSMGNSKLLYAANALAIHGDRLPKYFIFFVTSRCNASCDFCHFKYQIEDPVRKKLELSVDEIEKIASAYGKISKLSFSGGEPFIRTDLPEIVDVFVRHCDPQIIDIPTNGSMPERIERTVKAILPHIGNRVLDIQLSIDGDEETHNRIRGIPGLYRKILDTYDRLSKLRETHPQLRLKMNLVYCAENRDITAKMARFFEEKFDFDRFQITYPHGNSVDQEIFQDVDFENFRLLSQDIQRHFTIRDRRDLHSLLFRAIKMVRDDVLRDAHVFLKDMGAICKAGERILVLDDIGEIYPCEPLWESVGNVREHGYDVRSILAGPRMAQFRDKHLGKGKCTCAWGCVALEKIIYTPSLYPRLMANIAYLLWRGGDGFAKRTPGEA